MTLEEAAAKLDAVLKELEAGGIVLDTRIIPQGNGGVAQPYLREMSKAEYDKYLLASKPEIIETNPKPKTD